MWLEILHYWPTFWVLCHANTRANPDPKTTLDVTKLKSWGSWWVSEAQVRMSIREPRWDKCCYQSRIFRTGWQTGSYEEAWASRTSASRGVWIERVIAGDTEGFLFRHRLCFPVVGLSFCCWKFSQVWKTWSAQENRKGEVGRLGNTLSYFLSGGRLCCSKDHFNKH